MVASISSISSSSASTKYFADDGYYIEGSDEHRESMTWQGKGVEELGLSNEAVTPEQFKAIMDGYVLGTNVRLGRTRDGEFQHKPGTDITLSAPKSVSLAALIGGDKRVIEAQQKAVNSTLKFIERDILTSRVQDKETKEVHWVKGQKMVAATFKHETSRSLDPQLHTHATIANMSQGEDEKWRTTENRALYNNIMLIGSYYHNELAGALSDLGYGIAKTGKNGQFEITDANGKAIYSDKVMEAFSNRTVAIRAYMNDKNMDKNDPALKQRAALLTREAKKNPDVAKLHEMWREQAKEHGLDSNIVKAGIITAPEPGAKREPMSALESVKWGIRHLEERNSVFTHSELLAAALSLHPGGIKFEEIDAAIGELTESGRLVATEMAREEAFTTDKALANERENISRLEGSKDSVKPIIKTHVVETHLEDQKLTEGQKEAVETILTSRDRVVGVQGYAGSGKTTMLNAVREIAEAEGKGFFSSGTKFIGLAPSSSAAHTLENEAGIKSVTLQKFLGDNTAIHEDREGKTINHRYLAKLKAEVKGSVIIVDEASMISSDQMRNLLRITDKLEPHRLVLVGDSKQLDAVNAGQPFQQLQQAGMETAVMDEIMRQRNQNLKGAVVDTLSGHPGAALERLNEDIVQAPRSELGQTAAKLWLNLPEDKRETTGLMAPTHVLREEINTVIRAEFAKEGILHGDAVKVEQLISTRATEAERLVAGNYLRGDVVIFERAIEKIDIEKGDSLNVIGNRNGSVLLEGKDGETIHLDPAGGIANSIGIYETAELELRAGDLIRWTRNENDIGLINTHEAEILKIEDGKVFLRNEDGREFEWSADHPALQHIDYGHNSTVHAAQGRTFDNVIAVLEASSQLTNQKTFYVEASRARESATFITDDLARLTTTLEINTGERMTALEAVGDELVASVSVEEKMQTSIKEARGQLTFEEHQKANEDAPAPEINQMAAVEADIAEDRGPEDDNSGYGYASGFEELDVKDTDKSEEKTDDKEKDHEPDFDI